MGQTNQPLERSRGRVSSFNRFERSMKCGGHGCRGLSSYTAPSCGPMVSGVAYGIYHGGGLTWAYPTLRAYHLFRGSSKGDLLARLIAPYARCRDKTKATELECSLHHGRDSFEKVSSKWLHEDGFFLKFLADVFAEISTFRTFQRVDGNIYSRYNANVDTFWGDLEKQKSRE